MTNVMLDKFVEQHKSLVENFDFDLELKEWAPDFGGSVCLKYRRESLAVMVTKSRDGVNYDVGNADLAKEHWYGIDILWNYLLGNDEYKKMKRHRISQFDFIKDHVEWLIEVFSPANQAETKARLHKLERGRSKWLFG